jgi:hypothetical protein
VVLRGVGPPALDDVNYQVSILALLALFLFSNVVNAIETFVCLLAAEIDACDGGV